MYDYLKLIIFNIIIIFLSFTFKRYIIIFYAFLLLFMLSYETLLKNKTVEGNIQDDIYNSLSQMNNNNDGKKEGLPLKKIEKILEKMLEKFTGGKMDTDNKCKGEFYINKLTNKECGEGFNERLYRIIDEGGGDCLHSELYKEKLPLPSCKFNENCDSDLDCESNSCRDGRCIRRLDCNGNMLSGCNRRTCLELNSGLDRDKYYYQNNQCKVDPCNEQNYRMCDESGCNSLSYKYSFDKTRNVCKKVVQDSDPDGLVTGSYMNLISNFKTENKGCNQNNPEDCSGVCSDFSAETAEYCNIAGSIDEPKPNYQCKTSDGENYYFNMNIRDTVNIYDNKQEFPCHSYNNGEVGKQNVKLNGVSLEGMSTEDKENLEGEICSAGIVDIFEGDMVECVSNITLSDGSIIYTIENIPLEIVNELENITKNVVNNLINDDSDNELSGITSFESEISIEQPNCSENKFLLNGRCSYCEPGSGFMDGECVSCPVGHYSSSSSGEPCQPCRPGTFADSNGSINCEECQPGTFASDFGSISCKEHELDTGDSCGGLGWDRETQEFTSPSLGQICQNPTEKSDVYNRNLSIGQILVASSGPLEGTAVNMWRQAPRTARHQICGDFFDPEILRGRGGCYQCREGGDGVDINNVSTYGNFCNVCCGEGR